MRKRRYEFNFWPGVADTMLVAFIIVLGLWFGHQSLTKLEEITGSGGIRITGEQSEEYIKLKMHLPNLESEIRALLEKDKQLRLELRRKNAELEQATTRILDLETALAAAKGKIEELTKNGDVLQAELTKRKNVDDKPPIISLPETSGYKFGSGTANLNPEFSLLLEKTVFAEITKVLDRGDVNTIEIIGHTDGQPVGSRHTSNLDEQLGEVLSDVIAPSELQPGSNADLGLIRAVAVRREIENWLVTKNLHGKISIRCYSAANSVPLIAAPTTAQDFAGEQASRRRIEIRFTQLQQLSEQPVSSPFFK